MGMATTFLLEGKLQALDTVTQFLLLCICNQRNVQLNCPRRESGSSRG